MVGLIRLGAEGIGQILSAGIGDLSEERVLPAVELRGTDEASARSNIMDTVIVIPREGGVEWMALLPEGSREPLAHDLRQY